MNFSIYYEPNSYTTTSKIMGRQSAGKNFLKGVATAYSRSSISGVGVRPEFAEQLLRQLKEEGFDGIYNWSTLPFTNNLKELSAVYYPAPANRELAASRNYISSVAYSLMGVTHTIASKEVIEKISDLIQPPFQPWDALICTSNAARTMVVNLQSEMREYLRETIGATRFVDIQLPVIPLGVDASSFKINELSRAKARSSLAINEAEIVFLFAGRLSFHAKANPLPVYQALQKVAKFKKIICMEAGSFYNEDIKAGFFAAQKALAPSVRFIWVDGRDEAQYKLAWQSADVFVSLSDNIQETFGLTPVEAMASGLPVVVSDWSGYKDTVREGIDGYRVATFLPSQNSGSDLALRYGLQRDSYDLYIGRTSMATVVDPLNLEQVLTRLAQDADLRKSMGRSGQMRASKEFEWSMIIEQYSQLASHLREIRMQGRQQQQIPWPQIVDPFRRFAHFSTQSLTDYSLVQAKSQANTRLQVVMSLKLANYVFDGITLTHESVVALLNQLQSTGEQSVKTLLLRTGLDSSLGNRALMWLWKFDLINIKVKK